MPIEPRPGYYTEPDSVEEYLFRNSLGSVLELDSAPTTANDLLPEQRFGINGTTLYFTWKGNTYSIALTLV